MRKDVQLVVDYPIKYAHMPYGDANFCLAQLYRDNQEYRFNIRKACVKGRPIMLDNGAWEYGKSMPVDEYIDIIEELQPEFAVIPDVYKNKLLSEKMTLEFFDKWIEKNARKTKLMFVPQGEDIDEIIDCYNEVINQKSSMWFKTSMVAIPKHVGEIMNRVTFTDLLYDNANIKFDSVHFLGYWNWEELMYESETPWKLESIDTKAPVKYALKKTFVTQAEYYNTHEEIDKDSLQLAIKAFQQRLGVMKCNL